MAACKIGGDSVNVGLNQDNQIKEVYPITPETFIYLTYL